MEGEDTMGRGYPGARWTYAKLNRAIWKKYVTAPMHLQRGVLWLCVYVDFGDGESLRTHMTERKYQPSRDQLSGESESRNDMTYLTKLHILT